MFPSNETLNIDSNIETGNGSFDYMPTSSSVVRAKMPWCAGKWNNLNFAFVTANLFEAVTLTFTYKGFGSGKCRSVVTGPGNLWVS